MALEQDEIHSINIFKVQNNNEATNRVVVYTKPLSSYSDQELEDMRKKGIVVPPPPPPPNPSGNVKDYAEPMPHYPGGINALRNEVAARFQLPESLKGNGETITITGRFVVLKDGTIGDVRVLKAPENCKSCATNYQNALKKLSKKFIPGKKDGKAVNVWYTLPVQIVYD